MANRQGVGKVVKGLWKSPWIGAVLIVLLTVVAYLPALRGGFIWDDDDHLTANPAMTAPDGLRLIWSSLAVSRYYPLTLTNFWIQRRLWGLNPMPYHLVNITLHALNGVLLFLVLRRLRVAAAWLAAALWVVHPVNVESVAWITELKNTQSGVFFFLALLCFLRFEAGGQRRWYALALLWGLAAVLSKPSTVVLPLVVLLWAWWERGRWQRADMVRVAPLFGLALGMSALTVIEQHGNIVKAGTTEWKLGMAERLVIGGKAVWFYAAKVFWPVQLAFVYPRWEVGARSFLSWVPLAGLIGMGVVLWIWRRQSWAGVGLFGFGFFVVALLPVLGFFDVYYFRYSFVADHFQYLASVGLIALVASVGARICERTGRLGRQIGAAAVPTILMVLGALTWRQCHVYRDEETLWRDTLTKNPNAWIAHNNLGNVLADQGNLAGAVAEYRAVLRIKPDHAKAHYNLGLALADQGKVLEAIGQYEQALRIQPELAEAHYNLGNALLRQGKAAEAIDQYGRALRIRPGLAEAHGSLGSALLQVGKLSEAVAEYREALRINPNYVEARNNLGLVLAGSGLQEEAVAEYRKALRINPSSAEVHNNLGSALVNQGKLTEAAAEYAAALRVNPNYAEAHSNLGLALAGLGKTEEAVAEYREAVRIRPDYGEARYSLGVLLAARGETKAAIAQYREALRLRPDWPQALRKLAWLLVTDEDASVRNAREAVPLAERLCEMTGQQQVDALEVLAAAYAEAGRFNDAIQVAQRSLELANASGQKDLVGHIQEQMRLYQTGRPYHEGLAPAALR